MKINIFNKPTFNNIFATVLDLLNVKYTRSFSNKYYNEHPYKYSLYGLSKMLADYNIESQGIQVKDKNNILDELEPPFIAYISGDFITVSNITIDKVEYIWRGKKINGPKEEFLKIWSGILLLIEKNENSIEPNYTKHRKGEALSNIKQIFLFLSVTLLLGTIAFSNELYANWKLLLIFIINSFGLYISYLLLLKQMHIHNNRADKICSLLIDKSDCNNILDLDVAKILGISWSEIGMSYFISNLFMIVFLPSYYPYMVLVNICALPYTLWSVWYQKFKYKQWCPLCLIVQGILWILFISNQLFGFIQLPGFSFEEVILTGCIYVSPLLIIHRLVPIISGYLDREVILQQYNSLKARKRIFYSLLQEGEKYEVEKSDSMILWGNLNANNLITVITNPHCNPCANMHQRLKNLLYETNNGYCIQYFLTSFNEELEQSNKLFISMYKQMEIKDFLIFLDNWYHTGQFKYKDFYQKYLFDNNDKKMLVELEKQKKWLVYSAIKATPTILYNGYLLPKNYQIEDLKYFY